MTMNPPTGEPFHFIVKLVTSIIELPTPLTELPTGRSYKSYCTMSGLHHTQKSTWKCCINLPQKEDLYGG
jgi:hypothetical protein